MTEKNCNKAYCTPDTKKSQILKLHVFYDTCTLFKDILYKKIKIELCNET